jgi:heat-inducible transcriptional repressor
VTTVSLRTPEPVLSVRQAQVLQALVSSYVGGATPVASDTIASLVPVPISSASVRSTLGELEDLELVEKPHRSSGRIPTQGGLRLFVSQLLPVHDLAPFEQRQLAVHLSERPRGGLAEVASRLLSERTRLLGFAVPPRLEGLVLRHVSFVRVSSERVLAILISKGGRAYQRVLDEPGQGDQSQLDRMAAALNERVAGLTLGQLRQHLLLETLALRGQAAQLLARAIRADAPGDEMLDADLVVGSRLALLEQPEFRDPARIRSLLQALEEQERLVELLDSMLEGHEVRVALGEELGESLQPFAVVVAPYGARGSVGVIGPSRMDYGRVIPVVGFVSRLLSEMVES